MFRKKVNKKIINLVSICLLLAIPLASLAESSPPMITLFTPSDSVTYNTRRILVFGKVNGTGSQVKEVSVNGKSASVTLGDKLSPNVINFSGEVIFDSDGEKKISVFAKDTSNNTTELSVKIFIDTISPEVTQLLEPSDDQPSDQSKITIVADGTGSNIASILINSVLQALPTQSDQIDLTSFVKNVPINIIVVDSAGNKSELNIPNPQADDTVSPDLSILTPLSGQIFDTTSEITLQVEVVDDVAVKGVFANGVKLSKSGDDIYSGNLKLDVGDNILTVKAVDTSNNESTRSIVVSYIPKELKPEELQIGKLTVTLPPVVENLNTALIEKFTQITTGNGKLIDLASVGSIEISNPPLVPDGASADIKVPEVEGLEIPLAPEGKVEVPKGFSFASSVEFSEDETHKSIVSEEEKEKQNVAILTDSTARAFIVGFAFLRDVEPGSSTGNRKFRFQTTDGKPQNLITTFTVPADASIGNAKVSIIGTNESLATISLRIAPSKEVTVGKRRIAKPQILEPINASIKKSASELKLVIKGKNLVGKIAIIDGKLQKLLSKAKFFTNVTFVPNDGIHIKTLKVLKNKIVLTAKLGSDLKPGVKLFNIITPKGADIGGIVFGDSIVDGKLETTNKPEDLILRH